MTDMTDDTREGEGLAARPFCGNEAFLEPAVPGLGGASVVCNECQCQTASYGWRHPITSPEDANQKAIAAWNRRALASTAQGVTVRALEWRTVAPSTFVAGLGADRSEYTILPILNGTFRVYGMPGDSDGAAVYETLDLAKAAAQTDYERRVLSALVIPPQAPDVAEAAGKSERPAITTPPPYMFATEGIYMINGYVQHVAIPVKHYSSNPSEAFGPMWVRADLIPQRTLNKIFKEPVAYWPPDDPTALTRPAAKSGER